MGREPEATILSRQSPGDPQTGTVRVAVLGSGSSGNATLLEAPGTRILVDAGFSGRDLERRLGALQVPASSISAVVVTHDHRDHTKGMGVLARRYGTPLYVTESTRQACQRLLRGVDGTRDYRPGRPFRVGSLRVEPFVTAHDAVDPVAVAVEHVGTGLRVGIATDLGRPTVQVRHALSGCHFLVLEANHDEGMLFQGPYPWSVKQRIASSHGHLSNQAAARLAVDLFHPGLVGVVLAHLSGECNRPDLAREVVGSALRRSGYRGMLAVASQEEPTPFFDLEGLRRREESRQLPLL